MGPGAVHLTNDLALRDRDGLRTLLGCHWPCDYLAPREGEAGRCKEARATFRLLLI